MHLLNKPVVLLLALFGLVCADDYTHKYEENEEVTVWNNRVGPYHNPQETYDYYSLPFCVPKMKEIRHKSDSLGVVLEGSDLTDSGLHILFKKNEKKKTICELAITKENAVTFVDAVKNHYWYQMYIDELPIWGMIGEYMVAEADEKEKKDDEKDGATQEQGFLYTHKAFSISYNGDRIIHVNLTSAEPVPIVPGEKHTFTYSVKWVETTTTFEARFDRYHDYDFFEHQIHWFSIFNSFMMVVFLCGLVALILMRTLKNDYARFTSEDDELELGKVVDESGWKQVHGDVFRPPKHLVLLAAVLGTGYQLLWLGMTCIALTLVGSFYHERGTIVTTFLVLYSLTSFVAGYSGASFFKRNQGEDWKKAMAITASLLPMCVFGTLFGLNFIGVAYQSTNVLSVGTIMVMLCIWLLVSCPLTILGTIVGRSMATVGDFPCRVNALMRPVPDGKWYTKPSSIVLVAGILPFGSIFIEMYFIFTSFWNYKFYYVYGFMLLVYIILIIVTMCVTIVATYFLLNAEDYRWQWTAYLSGGSTAAYVYLYAIYYFVTKTRMSGILQTFYYFGYMGLFCLGLFFLTGTIGHLGAHVFVHRIYRYIKSD